MTSDPTILFARPKAVSAADKRALQVAGVIVVEVEDPQAVKFVRAATEISSTTLLVCAMEACLKSGYTSEFGSRVARAIIASHGGPVT